LLFLLHQFHQRFDALVFCGEGGVRTGHGALSVA
jgi:hypothetical protein